MDDFITGLAAATHLDPMIAKPAIGHVLLFLRDKAPQGRIAQFIDETPQVHEAVAAAVVTGDGGHTPISELLANFVGQRPADINILAGKLFKLGLDESQITALIEEILSRAEDLIGVDGVREIREILPALVERTGREAYAPSRAPRRRPIAVRMEPPAMRPTQTAQTKASSEPNAPFDTGIRKYWAREAVGVLDDADTLEETINLLGNAGFARAAISVLAPEAIGKDRLGRVYKNVREIEESGAAPRTDFVSSESRAEGQGILLGGPFYIGGAAGLWAVLATGGSLAFAIAAAIALGSLGASLGAVLAGAIERHHLEEIQEQLKLGGLVLWVTTPNAEAQERALTILRKAGAKDVHVHEILREWNMKEIPLSDGPYDPFVGLLGEFGPEKKRSA
jgi:hypothetical protein